MSEESFGIIPYRDGKVLLVQLHAGHWGFPKGHAEPGETPLEAAKRELLEETGLIVVSFLSDNPFQESYTVQDTPKTVSYYLAEVEGEVTPQEEEILDWGWFSLDSVYQRLTYSNLRSLWLNIKNTIS